MKKLIAKSILNKSSILDNMERQQKKITIESIDLYDFEGSLDRAIAMLTEIKNNSKEFNNLSVSVEIANEDDESYALVNIKGSREENDKEYDDRVNKVLKKELNSLIKNNKNEEIGKLCL